MTGYLKQSPPALQFVTFFGFFIGFMLIYNTALMLLMEPLTGHTLEGLQLGDIKDPNLIAYLKITQFLYSIIVYLVPAGLFAYLWQPNPWRYLGLKPAPTAIQILLALMAMISVTWFSGFTGDWNQTWNVPQAARDMQQQAEKLIATITRMPTPKDLVINLILMAIVPAVTEEVFFRGVFQRLLIKSTNRVWLSVFLSAIFFSFIHFEMLGFVPRVVLGFTLGAIYVLSGNLWLPILAHIMNNGYLVVMLYLFQHGHIKTDPAKDTPVAWYIGLFSLVVTIGLLWALRRKSTPMDMTDPAPPVDKDGIHSIGMDENQ
ncbi:CPBP family intramembrane glutamic endopeptidase [Chitinophaga qingshengii]|uniref:CPBP family intramembrane metalloprotease n=1 Tax=Chitinophaga qingshengii TaxID=1569794 RepID=A0ABR7TPL7_9BACT|nr:CPBP family intramembrane glutamic endopeptidase [Chitinophaga qingshengii]MBC9931585.1 CPBP family intramembrane metalloprotease [Chitinophaga qingshengii]